MKPYYESASVVIYNCDCREVLPSLSDLTAIVTDAPYGLSFMGKEWDRGVPGREFWELASAACLPGAALLAFGGTRTFHRLACAIEDAGWEIRDCLSWLYGQGFPKSLDVSKAIDKQRTEDLAPVDAVRSWLNSRRLEAALTHDAINKHFGHASNGGGSSSSWMTNPTSKSLPTWDQWLDLKELFGFGDDMDAEVWRLNGRKGAPGEAWASREFYDEPTGGLHGGSGHTVGRFTGKQAKAGGVTDAARAWSGYGTALKPAWESILSARKPLEPSTELRTILANLSALEARLCLLLSDAGLVALASPFSPNVPGLLDSAQWSAERRSVTRGALSEATDTSRFDEATISCLSIVQLWSARLAESWGGSSTSTIATASSTIIDARTLRFLASRITPEDIIQAELRQRGSASNASLAASAFSAAVASIASTRALSALAPAISSDLERCQGAGGAEFAPDWSPIFLARKPLAGTVAQNALAHGCGAVNVDGCRVGAGSEYTDNAVTQGVNTSRTSFEPRRERRTFAPSVAGRWPANVVLDECSARVVDDQSGESRDGWAGGSDRPGVFLGGCSSTPVHAGYGGSGGASRFFYVAKSSQSDRSSGGWADNTHATVKPTTLMRWLVRLVAMPSRNLICDPFMGSGSTLFAARDEHVKCIGIELDERSCEIAARRLAQGVLPFSSEVPA